MSHYDPARLNEGLIRVRIWDPAARSAGRGPPGGGIPLSKGNPSPAFGLNPVLLAAAVEPPEGAAIAPEVARMGARRCGGCDLRRDRAGAVGWPPIRPHDIVADEALGQQPFVAQPV